MFPVQEGPGDSVSSRPARRKSVQLELKLHDVLNSFGYQDIETPTFEYFDVFGRETGTIPSAELYKFFDKEGNPYNPYKKETWNNKYRLLLENNVQILRQEEINEYLKYIKIKYGKGYLKKFKIIK